MKALIAVLTMMVVAGCKTTCPIPEQPKVVRVPVDRYIPLPAWATKPLPVDAPKANTPEEAVRLASSRLETIRLANCRAALLRKLEAGEKANPKECE